MSLDCQAETKYHYVNLLKKFSSAISSAMTQTIMRLFNCFELLLLVTFKRWQWEGNDICILLI